jgi:hypothetical protein
VAERHVNGGNRCGHWRRDGRREALAHCFTEGHHDAAANSAGLLPRRTLPRTWVATISAFHC